MKKNINFIEEKLLQGTNDSPEILKVFSLLNGLAGILSRAYNDSSFLITVERLAVRLGTRS